MWNPPWPIDSTLGRTAIGLRDLRVVKLFLVGEGDERLGEKRESTLGEAAGEEGAEEAGIDNHNWSEMLGLLAPPPTSMDIESYKETQILKKYSIISRQSWFLQVTSLPKIGQC
jgi:hypothetical protein